MGRVIGRVDFCNGDRRFFIHCSTSEASLRALSATTEQAWANYDAGKRHEPVQSPPGLHAARVGRKVIAMRREFYDDDVAPDEPVYCLATDQQLLTPLSYDDRHIVVELDGVAHVGTTLDAGFFTYDVPMCNNVLVRDPVTEEIMDYPSAPLEHYFDKATPFCADCIRIMER